MAEKQERIATKARPVPEGFHAIGHTQMKLGDSNLMVAEAGGPWKPMPVAIYLLRRRL